MHKHISDEDGRTEEKDVKKFMGGRTTDRFWFTTQSTVKVLAEWNKMYPIHKEKIRFTKQVNNWSLTPSQPRRCYQGKMHHIYIKHEFVKSIKSITFMQPEFKQY